MTCPRIAPANTTTRPEQQQPLRVDLGRRERRKDLDREHDPERHARPRRGAGDEPHAVAADRRP